MAVVIGTEAALVMIGWVLGIDALTRTSFPGINMAFPTGMMFFLGAIGLCFMSRVIIEDDFSLSPLILSGIALLVFLINVTIFTSGLLGVQTGMENLFIQGLEREMTNKELAGLPALPTMIGFVLFGLASVTSLFPGVKRSKVIGLFGYLILIIGLVAVVGYLFELPLLYYRFSDATIPMAFNTALTFVLLGYGLVILGMNKIK